MERAAEHVLIVDDDESVLQLCGEALRRQSLQVTAALSGQAALEACSNQLFDIILLDLVLPDVDGLTLLGACKEADPDACVILMTGHASVDSAVEAVRHGAYDYLRKPFGMHDICRVVARGLEQRRLARQNRQLLAQLDVVNRDLKQKVSRATEELTAFVNLGRRLDRGTTLSALQDLLEAAAQLCGATTSGIFHRDSGGALRALVCLGGKADELKATDLSPDPLVREAAESERPRLSSRLLQDDPKVATGPLALAGFDAAMALPLLGSAGDVGVLILLDGPEPFTDRQASLVKVIAAQIAEVLVIARMNADPELQGPSGDGFVGLSEVLSQEGPS